MPSPKKCKSMYPEGSKAYNDCVSYKGMKKGGMKKGGMKKGGMMSPKKGY
jgi:hypothetical protein